MTVVGTKLPTFDIRYTVAIGGKPDMTRTANSVENDPQQTLRLINF
jgi:hypothetical protein